MENTMQLAPLGKRFGAIVIDVMIMAVLTVIFGRLMLRLGMNNDLAMLLAFGALPPTIFLISWVIGNTPGKKVFGLYIVDEKTGGVPSFWQFLRRAILFSFYVTFNLLTLIPMLVSKNKKTFHDMLAGTIVVEG